MHNELVESRLPFDPELRAALAVVGGVFPPTVTPDLIPFMRASYASPPREDLLRDRRVVVEDLSYPTFDGTLLEASVVRPTAVSYTHLTLPTILLV